MKNGTLEKVGPKLVLGAVFVLASIAFWKLLSKEPEGAPRGRDQRMVVTSVGKADIRAAPSLPGSTGTTGSSGPSEGERPTPPPASPREANLDDLTEIAPRASLASQEPPATSDPPVDNTYYPGPDPAEYDAALPDGPPLDETDYPVPPPLTK